MEIGTTTISTAEYMELRAMKDNLEANADRVQVTLKSSREWRYSVEYQKRGEVVKKLTDLNDIARSLSDRLHFLFTGELFKTKW